MLSLLGLLRLPRISGRKVIPHRPSSFRQFRPTLESLEGREVPSATPVAPSLGPAQVAAAPMVQQAASILPITVNNVVNNAGSLVANASLGSTNFQIPLTLGVPSGQSATTQILNLHLAPIHLNLLGLKVDTSEICLNITAQSGSGNLLGNLLSGIAGSLDRGLSLNQALGSLSALDLGTVTSGLTSLLNGALSQLTSLSNAAAGASVASGTNILHLSVGPLNLNLLGLQVNLDNCHNGPITVDISAQPGPGKLLGNLLNSLSHALDAGVGGNALLAKLNRITNEIASLI